MRRRTLALLWLVAGVVLWNVIFDLYVARGAQQYLQLRAEFELGRIGEPSMEDVMAAVSRRGAVAATFWAGGVVAGGWLTIVALTRRGTIGD